MKRTVESLLTVMSPSQKNSGFPHTVGLDWKECLYLPLNPLINRKQMLLFAFGRCVFKIDVSSPS